MGGLPKGVPHNYPQVRNDAVKRNRMLEKQDLFLTHFESLPLVNAVDEVGKVFTGFTRFAVGYWLIKDPIFKEKYDAIKSVKQIVAEEMEEDYLHKVGTGQEKSAMPNVVAAKMGLTARNPNKWSDRIRKETHHDVQITKIEYALTPGRTVEQVTEGQFKELPSGNTD
jgi:hypothetical protein